MIDARVSAHAVHPVDRVLKHTRIGKILFVEVTPVLERPEIRELVGLNFGRPAESHNPPIKRPRLAIELGEVAVESDREPRKLRLRPDLLIDSAVEFGRRESVDAQPVAQKEFMSLA